MQIVGGGRMGEAIAHGLVVSGFPGEVIVADHKPERRDYLLGEYPELTIVDSPISNVESLIAVKPDEIVAVCEQLKAPTRVISIAAGVSTVVLRQHLESTPSIVRAMPNLAAVANGSATAMCVAEGSIPDDVAWARSILSSVGTVVELTEPDLDAVTAVSGSGPAFLCNFLAHFVAAAEALGLESATAKQIATQTFIGTARLLEDPDLDPVDIVNAVNTPGGATAAGLAVYKDAEFARIVLAATSAAAQRSIELGIEDV